MELTLKPKTLSSKSLISMLYVDGVFECFILEDIPRDKKVYAETCIPAGIYKIEIIWSPTFKKKLPHLISVPGFDGILMHSGNTDKDTKGCLLTGETAGTNQVLNSRIAFGKLFTKMLNAESKNEGITIDVRRPSKVLTPNLVV